MERHFYIRFNIDTIDSVNNPSDALEANLEGVINPNAEEVFDGGFAHVETVVAGVGELVREADGAVELDVIVAWDVNEEDFAFGGVDDGKNIDVTVADAVDICAAGVGAGNVDNERLFNDVNRRAKIGLGFVFDAKIFE